MSNSVAGIQAAATLSGHRDSGGLYAEDAGRKYLNREERRRAFAAMAELGTDKALFALTLGWTGARVSEVLAATPASVQIERGVVAFKTLKRRRHSVREVPIRKGREKQSPGGDSSAGTARQSPISIRRS